MTTQSNNNLGSTQTWRDLTRHNLAPVCVVVGVKGKVQ